MQADQLDAIVEVYYFIKQLEWTSPLNLFSNFSGSSWDSSLTLPKYWYVYENYSILASCLKKKKKQQFLQKQIIAIQLLN